MASSDNASSWQQEAKYALAMLREPTVSPVSIQSPPSPASLHHFFFSFWSSAAMSFTKQTCRIKQTLTCSCYLIFCWCEQDTSYQPALASLLLLSQGENALHPCAFPGKGEIIPPPPAPHLHWDALSLGLENTSPIAPLLPLSKGSR